MACPDYATIISMDSGKFTPELWACYDLATRDYAKYQAQYSAGALVPGTQTPVASATPTFIEAARNNPTMLTQPQPGTVPVSGTAGLISTIFGILGQGANQYQKYRMDLAKANLVGKTLYVDPNLAKQAQTPANKMNWPLIIGVGVAVVAVLGLVAYSARKE